METHNHIQPYALNTHTTSPMHTQACTQPHACTHRDTHNHTHVHTPNHIQAHMHTYNSQILNKKYIHWPLPTRGSHRDTHKGLVSLPGACGWPGPLSELQTGLSRFSRSCCSPSVQKPVAFSHPCLIGEEPTTFL